MEDLGHVLKSFKGKYKEKSEEKRDIEQVSLGKVSSIQESSEELEEVVIFFIIFCSFLDFFVNFLIIRTKDILVLGS